MLVAGGCRSNAKFTIAALLEYSAATIETRYRLLGSGLIPVDSMLGNIENIAVGYV